MYKSCRCFRKYHQSGCLHPQTPSPVREEDYWRDEFEEIDNYFDNEEKKSGKYAAISGHFSKSLMHSFGPCII